MGISNVTTLDTTYAIRVDQATSTEMYVGEAPIGSSEVASVWRIKKLLSTDSTISLSWADGNQAFDNVWGNRTSLTYL